MRVLLISPFVLSVLKKGALLVTKHEQIGFILQAFVSSNVNHEMDWLSLASGRTVNRDRSPRLKASGRQNNVGKGSRQTRSVTSGSMVVHPGTKPVIVPRYTVHESASLYFNYFFFLFPGQKRSSLCINFSVYGPRRKITETKKVVHFFESDTS